MQKLVILSPTRGKDSDTDGHNRVVVVLHCRELAFNCSFVAVCQLAMLCVCHVTKIQLTPSLVQSLSQVTLFDHSLGCH